MKLCQPHFTPIKGMVKLGVFKHATKSRYVVVNPSPDAVKLGELFVYNNAVYTLKKEPNQPYPRIFRLVPWFTDLEIVTYHENQVGIILEGEKQVVRNIRKVYENKFGSNE